MHKMRAARIENSKVVDIWEVPTLDCYGDQYTLVEASEEVCVGYTYDGTIFKATAESLLVKQDYLTNIVQSYLDTTAISKGYDSILSACSYAGIPNRFQADGLAFLTWRSAVWEQCYKILDEVLSGTRPVPSDSELLQELPTLVL